jgi:hypothetical protein
MDQNIGAVESVLQLSGGLFSPEDDRWTDAGEWTFE